ncbi:GTP pyrophosphokinase [Longimonas halophila]|nr:RelA/SpoT domain-containing protein [Longimonas halophila]
MTETEIIKRYTNERPMYEAYGEFIVDEFTAKMRSEIESQDFGDLFKVEPSYRTKEPASLVAKALYRAKGYENPYEEINDKVGARFVVLLQTQLEKASALIEDHDILDFEKSRDFKDERHENPLSFEYQSIHYIVRPTEDVKVGNMTIPTNTPCEIQLRTLLQHAYSELTHDTVYKPRLVATPDVQRVVAKSMALIETTGELFSKVEEKLRDMDKQYQHITDQLTQIYDKFSDPEYNKRLNDFLLSEFHPLLEKDNFNMQEVIDFYESSESSYITEYINDKSSDSLIYRQPAILLVAYLVKEYKFEAWRHWPLPQDELAPIYSKFGYSLSSISGKGTY